MLHGTYPIRRPTPRTSCFDGIRGLKTGSPITGIIHDMTVETIRYGKYVSKSDTMLWMSESEARSPNGSPKAKSEITSSAKYCILRAMSNGLLLAMYDSSSRIKFLTELSIFSSRCSTSLPEYYKVLVLPNDCRRAGFAISYPASHFGANIVMYYIVSYRNDIVLSGLKLQAVVPG